MNFTLSSLLTVLIFSNLAILLFHYIINSAFLYYKFAFPILLGIFFHMAFSDIEKNETLDIISIAVKS